MTKKCPEGIVIKSFSDKSLFLRSILTVRAQKVDFPFGQIKVGGVVILPVTTSVEILHKATHMNILKVY